MMKTRAPTRTSRKKTNLLRCVLCGSSDSVQRHHVGGRFHVAWFTMPLCRKHHEKVTAFLRASDIDMRYTPNASQRIIRVLQALVVFLWMVLECLKEQR